MNQQTYDLILAILGSDIEQKAKSEIVKYYLLPRNTPVKPAIEYGTEFVRSEVGTVKRPDAKERDKREHPEKYEGEEAMRETLKSKLEPNDEG